MKVLQTDAFKKWLMQLRDTVARGRIVRRLERLQATGAFGNTKPVGEGVHEMRFMFGPGYRVYYGIRGDEVVIILAGGDKATQSTDVNTAIALWKEIDG